jgi:alpha-tubulin suppressor-like RCC1 family protein
VRVVKRFGAVVFALFMIGCEAAEFGNPYAGRAMPTPGRVSGERNYVQVAAGFFHSCGLTTAGAAFCWGSNEYRQLGTTQSLPQCELRPCSRTPLPVTGSHQFTQLASSMSRSCGLAVGGSAWCWGGGWEANGGGWLGDGAPQTSAVPVRVAADSPFVAITLGTGHGCALTASGMAFCWGQNGHGQVGDSSKVDRPIPVPVAGGRRFRAISAGGLHTCAIATDGAAWCWGSNRYGQLGIGDVPYNAFTFARIHPGRVLGQHGWSAIIAGGEHSCGIDTAGAGDAMTMRRNSATGPARATAVFPRWWQRRCASMRLLPGRSPLVATPLAMRAGAGGATISVPSATAGQILAGCPHRLRH